MAKSKATEIGPVTNGAKEVIEAGAPYVATVRLQGVCDMLFHAWNVEAIDSKGKAKKGSEEKKTDNVESYVYRNDDGELCIPGMYLRGAIVNAARYKQDPRSARKSAMDLYKAAVVPLTTLASLGTKKWDYEHKGRVTVMRAGITRTRPAMKAGWMATFELLVTLPAYVSPFQLREVIDDAGRLVGLADFRPTYGRFVVQAFEVSQRPKLAAA